MTTMLRHKNIVENWNISESTASRRIKDFENEVMRRDSVFPDTVLIRAGRIRLVEEDAFIYFMSNYDMLIDKTARQRVPKFTRRIENNETNRF